MLTKVTSELKAHLRSCGVEIFLTTGATISLDAEFEPPCSLKWMNTQGRVSLGAFSYAVSGFYADVSIGRYTSIGEDVQVGRSNHSLDWMSTSPFFYLREKMFDVETNFECSSDYHGFLAPVPPQGINPTKTMRITIGNDVYVGHGALIMPGINIGHGAVVAAGTVVTKDVPPFAIVAGVPAEIKKMRLPSKVASGLLESEWWQFAPWDLRDVHFWNPEKAVFQLRELIPKLKAYQPPKVRVRELLATSQG